MSLVDVRISATSQYGQLSEQIGGLDKRLRVIERGGLTVSGGGTGGTVSDATTLLKGKLRLGNYLGGTADDPTVNRVTDVTGEQLKAFHGLAGGPSGAQWQLSQGTIASPYAIALPSLVVQRTQEISSPSTTTPYGGPADPQWYSSIVGIARGNAGDNTMVSGLVGAGHQYSTTAAASPPGSNAQDAAGLWAIGAHHGIGAGFGAYIEGRIDATSGTPGVGARCRGIEVRTSNYEAVPTDSPYVPASITNNKMNGIQLSALVYNDSTKLVGTGIVFYRPNAGAGTPRYGQFDVGIGVTAYEDPIRNAFIRDDGTSVNSILINGTHSGGAIKIADGAGDLIAGDDFKLKGPRPYIDVTHPDYGADPTGVSGDIGAIVNTAIAALPSTGGEIRIPAGTYRQTTTITINKPVRLIGAGIHSHLDNEVPFNPATQVKWAGSSGGKMMTIGPNVGGWWLDRIAFNANNLASTGIEFLSAANGGGGQIAVINVATATGVCMDFKATLTGNTDFNHFGTLYLKGATLCSFTGLEPTTATSGGGNVCHVVIDALFGNYNTVTGSAHGLDFRHADNIKIGFVFMYCNNPDTGTGYAVNFGPWGRSNTIDHLQPGNPSPRAVRVGSGANPGHLNQIKYYDRENGQVAPTFAFGGATLSGTITAATQADPIVCTYTGSNPADDDGIQVSGTGPWGSQTFWGIANVDTGAKTFELFASYGAGGPALSGTPTWTRPRPRLTWHEESKAGDGWYWNAASSGGLSTPPVDHVAKFGGSTDMEVFAQATSDSSTARFIAEGKDSGGTVVQGILYALSSGAVMIGGRSSHEVNFAQNNATVFRLNTTGQVQLATGKHLYGGDGIVVKAATPIDDTAYVVPTNGMLGIDSATDTLKYRSNGNWFSAGGAFTPTTPFTVTGTTLSEIVAESSSNSSEAYLRVKSKESGGTVVHGSLRATATAVIVSATSSHPVQFYVAGTESFEVTTSRHVYVLAGNRIGLGVASPAAALDLAASVLNTDGLLFGETYLYRIAANALKLNAATGGGLAVTPATGTTSPISAGAQGVFLNATGIIDINRTAGANNAAIRIYAATNPTETSPRLRIDGDGTFLWSADGTTRTVRLKPTAAQTLSLEGSADGTTWTTAPILRFPTAASTILFEAGGILQCSATGGLKIGSASSDYVSFFGATPKQRPSGMTTRVSAITDSTTGTPATSIGAPPVFYSTDGNYLENALASILTLLNNNKTRIDELSDRVNENATTGLGLISGTA